MKFLGKTHIIIMGIILFACVVWMEYTLIKLWFISKKQQQTFPCTYISGSCTVKPTYKNCERFGNVPIGVCETRLNYGDFRTPND